MNEIACGTYLWYGDLRFVVTRLQGTGALSRLGATTLYTVTAQYIEDRVRRAKSEGQVPFQPAVGMAVMIKGSALIVSKMTLDESEVTPEREQERDPWPERRYQQTIYLDCRDALSLQDEHDREAQAARVMRRAGEDAESE